MNSIKHKSITEKIINAFYTVYNVLEAPIKVFYNGQIVGEYFADLLVDN
jgi:hypothetical protein